MAELCTREPGVNIMFYTDDAERPLFWNQEGLWRGSPKGHIVREAADNPAALWELYDMETDCIGLNNRAQRHPDRAKKMAAMYAARQKRVAQCQ